MGREIRVNLATLKGGDFIEYAQRGFDELIANCKDESTEWDKKRTIKVVFNLVPLDEERKFGNLEIFLEKKLAPERPMYVNLKFVTEASAGKVTTAAYEVAEQGEFDLKQKKISSEDE